MRLPPLQTGAAALLSGIALALAFPAADLPLMAWFGMVPLLWAIDGQPPAQAFRRAYLCGVALHLLLVYWVTVSMTLFGGLHPAAAALVLLVLALVLGVFTAAPFGLASWIQCRSRVPALLTLPFVWVAAEHCQSWLMTGFPWGLLGYSQYRLLPMVQIADVTGVYGISWMLVLANCGVYALLRTLTDRRLRWRLPAAAAVVTLAVWGYGVVRLDRLTRAPSPRPAIRLALIQPGIAQHLKWLPSYLDDTMTIFRALTLQAAAADPPPEMIVWPESATPFMFRQEPAYRAAVESLVRQTAVPLLLGTPSCEPTPEGPQLYNTAFLLDPSAAIIDRYDKVHLVPWGEYVPLQLPFMHNMVAGIGDFSPGPAVRPMQSPLGAFGTAICYEIIFPGLIRQFSLRGASFLVNITNDAWFGRTSAPAQHLAMTTLRAVENRRWIARCANTGISAVISPTGAITARTDLFTREVLPATIYPRIQQTFYTRCGDLFAYACWAVSLALLWAAWRRRRSRAKAVLSPDPGEE